MQIGKRVNGEFIVIIHSGEYFISDSALRNGIMNLKLDISLDAALTSVEHWTSDMSKKVDDIKVVEHISTRNVYEQCDFDKIDFARIRDCMAIYRTSSLFECDYVSDDTCEFLGQFLIPQFMSQEKRVVVLPFALCKYSDISVENIHKEIPKEFGNRTLKNIEKIIVASKEKQSSLEKTIFQNDKIHSQEAVKKKNKYVILYNLSSFTRIKNYTILSLLLFIVAALFLHLETPLLIITGKSFFLLALVVGIGTIGMLGCNLYFKKNPQRLVIQNEK